MSIASEHIKRCILPLILLGFRAPYQLLKASSLLFMNNEFN